MVSSFLGCFSLSISYYLAGLVYALASIFSFAYLCLALRLPYREWYTIILLSGNTIVCWLTGPLLGNRSDQACGKVQANIPPAIFLAYSNLGILDCGLPRYDSVALFMVVGLCHRCCVTRPFGFPAYIFSCCPSHLLYCQVYRCIHRHREKSVSNYRLR